MLEILYNNKMKINMEIKNKCKCGKVIAYLISL